MPCLKKLPFTNPFLKVHEDVLNQKREKTKKTEDIESRIKLLHIGAREIKVIPRKGIKT